jgi:hypothetical protein
MFKTLGSLGLHQPLSGHRHTFGPGRSSIRPGCFWHRTLVTQDRFSCRLSAAEAHCVGRTGTCVRKRRLGVGRPYRETLASKPWVGSLDRVGSRRRTLARAAPDTLLPLGLDFLTFLAATVLVIPLFKSVKASPVLGFLFSGLILGQLG